MLENDSFYTATNEDDKAVKFAENVKVVRVARVDSGMLTELFYSVQDFLRFSKETGEEQKAERQRKTREEEAPRRAPPQRRRAPARGTGLVSDRQKRQATDSETLQHMRNLRVGNNS